jgi:hypothetical protein
MHVHAHARHAGTQHTHARSRTRQVLADDAGLDKQQALEVWDRFVEFEYSRGSIGTIQKVRATCRSLHTYRHTGRHAMQYLGVLKRSVMFCTWPMCVCVCVCVCYMCVCVCIYIYIYMYICIYVYTCTGGTTSCVTLPRATRGLKLRAAGVPISLSGFMALRKTGSRGARLCVFCMQSHLGVVGNIGEYGHARVLIRVQWFLCLTL